MTCEKKNCTNPTRSGRVVRGRVVHLCATHKNDPEYTSKAAK